jgi:hypothetical protein
VGHPLLDEPTLRNRVKKKLWISRKPALFEILHYTPAPFRMTFLIRREIP